MFERLYLFQMAHACPAYFTWLFYFLARPVPSLLVGLLAGELSAARAFISLAHLSFAAIVLWRFYFEKLRL